MENEVLEQYRFYLSSEHIDALDKVDPNHSKALRTILNSKNRYEKRKHQKQILDRMFLMVGLGTLFLIFSLTASAYYLSIQIVGICIILYGVVRGITDGVQTSR